MKQPQVIDEQEVYRGRLRVVQRTIRHPNGGLQSYEIVNPGTHSVCAVAFDTGGDVLLVELYRFGQDRRLKELPAGGIEPGESFRDAMARELLEETGYQGELIEIGSHPIAAEHGVTRQVYAAKNCRRISAPKPEQSEIDEGAKVVLVSLEAFKDILRRGELTETAAAFMVLDRLGLL